MDGARGARCDGGRGVGGREGKERREKRKEKREERRVAVSECEGEREKREEKRAERGFSDGGLPGVPATRARLDVKRRRLATSPTGALSSDRSVSAAGDESGSKKLERGGWTEAVLRPINGPYESHQSLKTMCRSSSTPPTMI